MTVDVLEARIAALTAEVERLRKGGAAEVVEATPEQAAEEQRRRGVWEQGAAIRALMATKNDEKIPAGAQEAFWRDVEKEAMALLRAKGPMYPGDLLTGLPRALLNRGSDVEMPLSVGWLRFRLRAMAEAGKPLAEKDGRFVQVEATQGSPGAPNLEEAEVRAPPPSLGDSVMWEIRRLLLERGPMRPAEIRKHLPQRVHEAARRHWKGGLDLWPRTCPSGPVVDIISGDWKMAATPRWRPFSRRNPASKVPHSQVAERAAHAAHDRNQPCGQPATLTLRPREDLINRSERCRFQPSGIVGRSRA